MTARTVSALYRALAAARQASRQHTCLCSSDCWAVVPAIAPFPPHEEDLGNVLAVPSHRGTLWNSLEFLLFPTTVCSRSGESTSFSQDMAPVAWSMLRQKHYQMAGFHLPVLSCSSACTHVARLHHPSR